MLSTLLTSTACYRPAKMCAQHRNGWSRLYASIAPLARKVRQGLECPGPGAPKPFLAAAGRHGLCRSVDLLESMVRSTLSSTIGTAALVSGESSSVVVGKSGAESRAGLDVGSGHGKVWRLGSARYPRAGWLTTYELPQGGPHASAADAAAKRGGAPSSTLSARRA